MEDEDIAPTTYTADPVGMGRKSCLFTILEYSVLVRYRLDLLDIFGAISSSSILRAHLYTTSLSMRTAFIHT